MVWLQELGTPVMQNPLFGIVQTRATPFMVGNLVRALIFSFSRKITKMFAKFLRNVVPISLLNT